MANGSPNSPRSSGLFSGVILLVLGVLLLFHNYGHLEIGSAFKHWWPLILVVWGLIKLYERTVASRQGRSSGWITAGEVFLVIGLLSLVGVVIIVDMVKGHVETGDIFKVIPDVRDSISFDKELPPQKIPANARIQINTTHGDLTVRSADSPELRVTGKANVKAWDENSAGKLAEPVTIEVAKEGEVYVVRPAGFNARDGRIGMDLEVTVPQKSGVTLHNEKGDLHVSDIASDVIISTQKGDIEVSDTGGSVNIDTKGGDTTVSDTKGDVKISGKGGEISVVNATGGLTIEGEFYGPIRADKVTKGVRFISQRTDFTLTQLSGHLETGSGNFEVVDAPGNLTLRTSSQDVSIENPGGQVNVENRNGNVEIRYSAQPKEAVQVTNSSSGITLSLPGNSSFEIQADCHSCDIENEFSGGTLNKTTTQSGDSHLDGKYGSGRPIKITLKTSYGTITIRKTS